MIYLIDFYLNNIKNGEYYYKFYNKIQAIKTMNDSIDYCVMDVNDAINRYIQLIQPRNDYSKDEEEFIVLSFFLNHSGVYIEQHPDVIARPVGLQEFAYDTIRQKIGGSPVPWADRRTYINSLIFCRKDRLINDEIVTSIVESIATSSNSFEVMSDDEKLENINNAIEYLLKDKKYQTDDEKLFLGLISNNQIKSYREKLHCFRHASKSALTERNSFTKTEKMFLVNYGVTIIAALTNNKE